MERPNESSRDPGETRPPQHEAAGHAPDAEWPDAQAEPPNIPRPDGDAAPPGGRRPSGPPGGFDDDAHDASENLELPVIPGLSVKALVTDALDQVATQRRGVVVLGPKGSGKSLALRHALGEFAALERARERRRPKYRRRRVLQVRGIRADRYVDAAVVLLREVSGTSPQVRVHGRLKKHDELLLELVLQLLEQRYAVVVVDEAELLSDEALDLLRDIISEAERRDPAAADIVLATPDANASAPTPSATRALGIGVLLVGTAPLGPRVAASDEAGERWVRRVQVRPVPATRVPSAYVTWFPAFGAHVDAVGAAVWETFVTSHVCRGRPTISMRRLENHARLYFRRMRLAARRPLTREQIPFDRDVFLRTHRDTDWDRLREGGE